MANQNDFIVKYGIVVQNTATISLASNLVTTNVVRTIANPSLDLNFTRYTSLDSRVSFSRASGATFVGSNGFISYSPNNKPRFDYDPVTGQNNGLLIEEQRTNLYTYSAQPSLWTAVGGSIISPSSIVAPDGALADVVTNTPSVNSYVRLFHTTLTTATTYTRTVYAKSLGGSNNLYMEQQIGGVQYTTRFDLSAGTVISTTTGTGFISNAGNGWWRCGLTVTTGGDAGANTMWVLYIGGYGTTPLTTPIGLWGAQLEVGAQPSTYIPTTSASVSRAADRCLLSAGPWYRPTQGTWYAEFQGGRESTQGFYGRVLSPSGSTTLLGTDGGSTSNVGTWGGGNALVLATGADYWTTVGKGAMAYDNTALTRSISGRGKLTTGAYTVSDGQNYIISSAMGIGQNSATSSNMLNGRIKRITYWPQRLTDAQLQLLTTS